MPDAQIPITKNVLLMYRNFQVPFIVGLSPWAMRLFRNSFLVPLSSSPFPIFYHIQGIWSYVKVLNPSGIEFCAGCRYGSICNLLHAAMPSSLTRNIKVAVSSTAFSPNIQLCTTT